MTKEVKDEVVDTPEEVVETVEEAVEEVPNAGHDTSAADEDLRPGWGCVSCARFAFDNGAPRTIEVMSCGACGGNVNYMGYSAWKRTRSDLFE